MKILFVICAAALMMSGAMAEARPIVNPDGSMPRVQWAVVESKEGGMEKMQALAARNVAPYAAGESGTYAIYGGIDKSRPNLLRLLEIYRDEAAYQEHRSSEGFKRYLKEREAVLASLRIIEMTPFLLESKTEGEGSVVRMARLEINENRLESYKAALREEITASVANEPGVLALLATTEKDKPNVFHLLEIYKDDAAYNAHLAAPYFQKYAQATAGMIKAKQLTENLPTTVRLTGKPFNEK